VGTTSSSAAESWAIMLGSVMVMFMFMFKVEESFMLGDLLSSPMDASEGDFCMVEAWERVELDGGPPWP